MIENAIKNIKNGYKLLNDYYNYENGKKEQLVSQLKKLEQLKFEVSNRIELLNNVKFLLQNVSDYARNEVKGRFEEIITNCLQYIFESDILFSVELKEVRERQEAEFFIVSDINGEKVYTKPQEARGGGVVDVISLAIRIAMIQCSNLDIDGPIILDEPAKHLSEEYIYNTADFLKQTTKVLNRQIIMVTHNKFLSEIADKWYRIEMDGDESRIVFES